MNQTTKRAGETPEKLATHTPGPWQVHHELDVAGYPCFFIHGLAGDAKRDTPMLDANARLIAAAPEMLAALRAIVTAIKNGDIHLYAKSAPHCGEPDLAAVLFRAAVRSIEDATPSTAGA